MRRSLRPYERDQVRGSWPRPRRVSATSQPGSPDSPATPASLPARSGARRLRRSGPWWGIMDTAMSTRYLIVAALVTGLVILAASAVQLLMVR